MQVQARAERFSGALCDNDLNVVIVAKTFQRSQPFFDHLAVDGVVLIGTVENDTGKPAICEAFDGNAVIGCRSHGTHLVERNWAVEIEQQDPGQFTLMLADLINLAQ